MAWHVDDQVWQGGCPIMVLWKGSIEPRCASGLSGLVSLWDMVGVQVGVVCVCVKLSRAWPRWLQ